MAARQTTYTDAQGNAQTGYIINNQTYKDAAGTQRIDNGSIVTADSGKQYVMTDAGGVLYDDYVKQSAPQAKQTQYIDPTGRSATGYIIDNRTYKDAAGTQRIDNGSLVTNASGTQTWVMTDKGGVPYEEYMAQQRKSEQNELIQQMLANAQEQQRLINEDNIRQLEAQLPKINETYDETLNQAYQGYRSAEKSLANQLAASGLYNSGYSDTAKVNQATAYGNQRNATERERAEAITGVNENIASQNIQNNAALLELQNQYNQLLLDQSNLDRDYDLQEKQVEHNISQDLWNNEQYLDDKQWSRAWDEDEREWSRKWDEDERDWSRKWNEDEREYERNQTAKQEELQKALYAIDHGGDYSLLAEYLGGVDLSMAEQYWKANMQALIREANLSGYKSTTGSSKSASEKLDALTKREVEMEAESLIRIYSGKEGTESDLINYVGGEGAKRMYTNKYGSAGYEYLTELIASEYSAYNSQSPTYALGYDDVAPMIERMLYGSDGSSEPDEATKESATQYIAGLEDLSDADAARLIARYGLTEAAMGLDAAEQEKKKIKIDLSDGVNAEEKAELKRRGLI